MTTTRGRFVSFEGIDGAGKSTHLEWFADRLRGRGLEVVATREPGGTPAGERLREVLLACAMEPETELLLVLAARREHLRAVIRPALERGAWVVCDRFSDSTYAYQGAGRGIASDRIAMLEAWSGTALQPDRTYLFDVPAGVAAERRAAARAADRFEAEDLAFFDRVRSGYLDRARTAPARVRVIDGRAAPEQVRKLLEKDIASLCSVNI